MKHKILGIIGLIISLIAAYRLVSYAFIYDELSQYGKGFVWGNALLLLLGLLLVFYWFKRRGKLT